MATTRSAGGTKTTATFGGNNWLTITSVTRGGRTRRRSVSPSALITVHEAAAALGMFDMQVYRLIKAGDLKSRHDRSSKTRKSMVRVVDVLRLRRAK